MLVEEFSTSTVMALNWSWNGQCGLTVHCQWTDNEDMQLVKTWSLLMRDARHARGQTEEQARQQSDVAATWRGMGPA